MNMKSAFAKLLVMGVCLSIVEGVESGLMVELRKAEDAMVVVEEGEVATCEITSVSGIGGATLIRRGDVWPGRVVVRLKLKGLEQIQLSNGGVWVEGFLKKPLRVPYWGAEARSGKPPLGTMELLIVEEEGWIEIVVPAEFMTDGSTRVELRWVDFFR